MVYWKGGLKMEHVKKIYKSFIMIFSETIWIYYLMVMFTSINWNQAAFFDLTWWLVAGVSGYALNSMLTRNRWVVLLFIANITALGFLILQNWRNIVPQGAWKFGLAVTIGLVFIFVRSAGLAYKQPTRREILQRFEGNVVYYIIFAIVFTLKNWVNQTFHIFFIFAIIMSLIGMILTLQSDNGTDGNERIEIIKVGQPVCIIKPVILLLICIPLISLILLIPSINITLINLGVSTGGALKWIVFKILSLFKWIISLTPITEIKSIPSPLRSITIKPIETMVKPSSAGHYGATITGIAVVTTVIAIWNFHKILNKRNVLKSNNTVRVTIITDSLWMYLKKRLNYCLHYINMKWKMCFPYYYCNSIYWYYNKLLRWGKRNGIPKLKTETSQEYVIKIIGHIPKQEKGFIYKGENYDLSELIRKLNKSYQDAFFGFQLERFKKTEFQLLINKLKGIRL